MKLIPLLESIVITKLFHKSPPTFRKSIKSNGLIPRIGDSYQLYYGDSPHLKQHTKPCIFATNNPDKDFYDSTYDDDIWEINQEIAGVEWELDPAFDDENYVRTFDKIKPEALTLVYKGTGESL